MVVNLCLLCAVAASNVSADDSPPAAQATFLDPGALIHGIYPGKRPVTEDDVRAELDALHELGIDTIVITYVEYIHNTWGAFYESSIDELTAHPNLLKFDLVDVVLSQADKNDQQVLLGIGRGDDPFLTYTGCDDPDRLEPALDLAKRVIRELHEKYATRYESFGGWYLTHECRDIAYASRYYNPLAELCHELTPGKPVMIAPDGAPKADADSIAACKADIFAYQDAVGAGFVPPPQEKYSYDPEVRLKGLAEVFERYAAWHAENPEKRIWATVELWQMDGPEYTAAFPAEWFRVRRQLEAVTPHVEGIIFYECGGFLESPESEVESGGPAAVRLFNAYRAWSRE
ncbi:MAG: DUF4434 domain-containing protein [Planctomycetota bacterium]|nr:MAG: DUF4434 domain-containing protein [Planctomycetota bacterium]REJ98491.1 MAG: DUF4434 domain-containing protein [Planctomycetota bacterium]REK23594.1 MAG: DUF4434 domain-containing protein [Planctomycetota bacterium]REK31181.1 MAG: DUF4434 domain-containing protein [Planctomycetota bacterium]